MRPSVRDAFYAFTAKYEGVVSWMYADVKQLVTTGVGNLIDPVALAVGLPWKRPDGTVANTSEVVAEWWRVKNDVTLSMRGHRAAALVTKLRLSDDAVRELVFRKLDECDRDLAVRFHGWDNFPADAQLGLLSMAWAMGAAFSFPMFEKCVREGDWFGAAAECRIQDHDNPGVRPRNGANRLLFLNAGRVVADGMDPAVLYFPAMIEPPPTLRDLSEIDPDDTLASRREATTEAIVDAVRDEVTRRNGG